MTPRFHRAYWELPDTHSVREGPDLFPDDHPDDPTTQETDPMIVKHTHAGRSFLFAIAVGLVVVAALVLAARAAADKPNDPGPIYPPVTQPGPVGPTCTPDVPCPNDPGPIYPPVTQPGPVGPPCVPVVGRPDWCQNDPAPNDPAPTATAASARTFTASVTATHRRHHHRRHHHRRHRHSR